jgi:hypothetical protein
MGGSSAVAERRLHGWSEKVGDQALFDALQSAKDRKGVAFHLWMGDQIERRANGYKFAAETRIASLFSVIRTSRLPSRNDT